MKRVFLFLILAFCAIGLFAQMKVYNNGQYFSELPAKAILKDMPQSHFSTNCVGEIGDENQSTPPVLTVENDSLIIKYIQYEQCCSEFALKVSDPINDTVYIHFADTAREQCDCMCNYEVRISLEKPELPMSYCCMLNYATYLLDLNDLIQNNTIVNGNSTWSTLSYVYGADEYGNTAIVNASTEFHFFDGDSIYNEKTYKKVFSYRDELHSERFFAGLIREENKKTYFVPYHIGLETLLEESILYDFTLEQGEAFEYVMGSGDYSETITLYVLQSDSVLINTVQKKRLIITLQAAPEIVIDTIVENVGSLHGLLYPICYMCNGAFNELLCYTHNGELLYQNPKRSKCYYDNPDELSFVQTAIMNEYGVYPNPVDDVLTVFSSNNTISKIDIFNVSGEKIHSQTNKNNIDVSSLNKGLYILKVYDINEQVDMFKFIKK